ncbi:MAG: hypothetical protein LBQ51_07065 [Desulfovibrio sp.]|jgi:hypothetical protein|nr:hypothetical protein [Desulfovibrio sp.]
MRNISEGKAQQRLRRNRHFKTARPASHAYMTFFSVSEAAVNVNQRFWNPRGRRRKLRGNRMKNHNRLKQQDFPKHNLKKYFGISMNYRLHSIALGGS